ncbi:MAG: hypothetical protein RL106_663, partial [Bacteroidota bacterium]
MSQVSFENTAIAFKGKDNSALRRSYWLFRLIGNPALVKLGGKMTDFALKINFPLGWAIKNNIFAQFCGGETIEECKQSADRLAQYGIGTILDYSVEGKEKESDFDATADEIIRTIVAAKGNPNIPFCVFKVTGVARFELLEKQNEVVRGS